MWKMFHRLSAVPSALRKPAAAAMLICALLLSAPTWAAAEPADATPTTLDKQVRQWVDALSAQPPFTAWSRAKPDIQPLGPGTHGWIIVLQGADGPVGYLVVHAAEDGSYRLGEYGTGPDVLFSEAKLRSALLENGLVPARDSPIAAVRHYAHPLSALWEVRVGSDTYWLDAKTGEQLPFGGSDNALPPANAKEGEDFVGRLRTASAIRTAYVRESFDPYERLPWLLGEKPLPAEDDKKAQARIARGLHLRYVSEPFGDAVLYALPVIGFHRWTGGRLDLALDMAGPRYVPFDSLVRIGNLYR